MQDSTAVTRAGSTRNELLVALGGAVVGVAVVVGGLFVGQARGLLLLLLLALLVPLLLACPTASLLALTISEAANLSGVAGTHGVPAVHLVLLGLATASTALAVVRRKLRLFWSPVFLSGLVLLCAQAGAAIAAHDPSLSIPVVLETARGMVFLVIVATLVAGSRRRPRIVAAAIVTTLAVLSLLTVVQAFALHDRTDFWGFANVPISIDIGSVTARHAGPQQDVNFWGRVLVLAVPLSLSLAVLAHSRLRRGSWLIAVLAILAGIYLTQSRGALLAAVVSLVVWALTTGRRYARFLLAAPLIIAAILAVPGVGSRLQTLSSLDSTSVAVPDPSLEGRIAAQQVGVRMVREHPLLGIGPGNFEAVEPGYLRQLGLQTIVLAPHNEYLEAAAEGGIVGLSSLLLFLGTAMFVALRSCVLASRGSWHRSPSIGRTLGAAVLAALSGWLAASLFLHLATFRSLLLIIALGTALDVQARDAAEGAFARGSDASEGELAGTEHGQMRRPPSGIGRTHVRSAAPLAGVLAAFVLLVLIGISPIVRTSSWQMSVSAELVLKEDQPLAPGAYELSTLSRDSLLRTYATIAMDQHTYNGTTRLVAGLRSGRARVDIGISPPSTVLSMTVTSLDRDVAVTANEALNAFVGIVNPLSRLYGFRQVSSHTGLRRVERINASRLFGLVALGGCLVIAGAWYAGRNRVALNE